MAPSDESGQTKALELDLAPQPAANSSGGRRLTSSLPIISISISIMIISIIIIIQLSLLSSAANASGGSAIIHGDDDDDLTSSDNRRPATTAAAELAKLPALDGSATAAAAIANETANGDTSRRHHFDQLPIQAEQTSEQQQRQRRQRILKKSGPYDQVNSADLPAEFRGGGGGSDDDELASFDDQQGFEQQQQQQQEEPASTAKPAEQSKLAKLCQQTSSVLASVLPAPFGGHKRSILCQFFGHVQMGAGGHARVVKYANSKRPQEEQSSQVAVIHPAAAAAMMEQPANQLAPIMLMGPQRHPIELLLEHQRQQHQQHQQQQMQFAHSIQQAANLMNQGDLKQSASVVDYSYQQRLEPPASMRQRKGSSQPPMASAKSGSGGSSSSSLAPSKWSATKPSSSPLLSTSGWRIFDKLPGTAESTTTTTGAPKVAASPSRISNSSSSSGVSNQANNQTKSSATNGASEGATLQQQQQQPVNGGGDASRRQRQLAPANESTSSPKQAQPAVLINTASGNSTRRQQDSPVSPNSSNSTAAEKNQNGHARQPANLSREKLGSAQLLSVGRQPLNLTDSHKQQQQQQPQQEARGAALKSTTAPTPQQQPQQQPQTKPPAKSGTEVRTIEVVAQSEPLGGAGPGSGHLEPATRRQQQRQQAVNTAAVAHPPPQPAVATAPGGSKVDPLNQAHQTKREELVIASINNLTRIAFGNQLRDTFRVINRLIDQQASLFSPPPAKSHEAADSMQTAESRPSAAVGGKPSSSSSSFKDAANQIKKPVAKAAADSNSLLVVSKSAKRAPAQKSRPSDEDEPAARHHSRERKSSLLGGGGGAGGQQSGESRRLSSLGSRSVSRSLSLDFARKTTKPLLAPFESSWQTTPGLLELDLKRDRPTSSSGGSRRQPPPSVVTQYPWLVPDRSSPAASRLLEQPAASSSRGWLVQSSAPTAAAESDAAAAAAAAKGRLTGKQALVLNRLEGTSGKPERPSYLKSASRPTAGVSATAIDSLTTLKMSLERHAGGSRAAPPQTTTTSSRFLAQTGQPTSSLAGGLQSRWIPTTAFTTRATTQAPTTTSSTTIPTTSTTAAAAFTSSNTGGEDETRAAKQASTISLMNKEPPSERDLMEARASDSISKYTTSQWGAADANELLASTRRRYYPAIEQQQHQQHQPQMAQTGEFFSAETISSWPERYHQAIIEGLKATTIPMNAAAANSIETTRRNGEAYETMDDTTGTMAATATAATARHRYEPTTSSGNQIEAGRQTTRADTTQFTVLPANHKLSSSSGGGGVEELPRATTAAMTTTTTTLGGNSNAESTSQTRQDWGTSTTKASAQQQQLQLQSGANNSSQGAPLRPPYSAADAATSGQRPSELPAGQPLATTATSTSQRASEGNSDELSLAGTTSEPQQQQQQQQQRPPFRRKQSQQPFGNGSLTAQFRERNQLMNLSALKLLSQGLLASLRQANQTGGGGGLLAPPVEQSILSSAAAGAAAGATSGETLNNSDRLLEVLGAASGSPILPANYYELLFNDSSSSPLSQAVPPSALSMAVHDDDGDDANDEADELSKTNVTSLKSKLLGRASNLLNDLKQLEQRKAAALLAAIRYQVPGPLVRPWDLGADLRERLDGSAADDEQAAGAEEASEYANSDAERDYLRASLWLTRASEAIRSALAKQRLVPRNELKARLASAGGRRKFSERRSDWLDSDESSSFVLEDSRANATANGQSRRESTDDAHYLIAGNSSSDQGSQPPPPPPPPLATGSGQSNAAAANRQSVAQYPKYIHLSDYKSNWNSRAADLQPKLTRQLSSSASIAARFRNATQSRADAQAAIDKRTSIEAEPKKTASESEAALSFDCSDKAAGFHPDLSTKCQTFYHCSSTGHLLTFNCPQQTRFDEQSLKCGPWFEVACDLGRAKSRQNPRP